MSLDPVTLVGAMIGLLLAFIVHEYAHAWAAYSLGDPTAKYAGKLTLNPIVHLDPIGSLVLLISGLTTQGTMMMGWAKPVVYDQSNFKHPFLDGALVAFAGPLSNLVMCLVFAVGYRFMPGEILAMVIRANLSFAIFNLFPLPPLDGWKIVQGFVPRGFAQDMQGFERKLGQLAPVLLLAASFTLISPITRPLYRILMGVLVG